MGFSPASSGSGGGIPQGGPLTADLDAADFTVDNIGPLVVDSPNLTPQGFGCELLTGDGNGVMLVDPIEIWHNADKTGAEFSIRPNQITAGGAALLLADSTGLARFQVRGDNGILFNAASGAKALQVKPDGTADLGLNATASVLPGGAIVTRQHAAPADGDLAGGECALWFDQTDGAGNTKLMVKAKSANGTVKTATILLA